MKTIVKTVAAWVGSILVGVCILFAGVLSMWPVEPPVPVDNFEQDEDVKNLDWSPTPKPGYDCGLRGVKMWYRPRQREPRCWMTPEQE